MKISDKLPFSYLVSVALTANGSSQTSLTLQTDSFFELVTIKGSTTLDSTRSDGAALSNPFIPNNFSVQITDQSTGRQLSNARVPQRIYAPLHGSRLLQPILLPPNTTLLFDFLDLSGSTPTVSLVLEGYKVFTLR